jgi:primosomal protein N'
MYVIQVIPLIRGTKLESLSYFSVEKYDLGSFLSVPVRKKNQPAVVTSCKPVSDSKTTLKSATFSLRKLPKQKNPVVVSSSIRQTAEKLAQRYPTSSGAILYHLLPPDIRNGNRVYPTAITHIQQEETTPQLLTARVDERFLRYQSHVRSTFASRGSVLFILPTTTDIEFAAKELSQGINERLVILSSNDPKKKLDEALGQFADTSHPKLIVTTPAYAYLERSDIKTIIIEQSASPYYVSRVRPYLDHRDALMVYAEVSGRSVLLGDTVPKTEDEVRRRQDKYLTYGEEVRRIVFPAPLSYLNLKDKPQPEKELPFELFSSRLRRTVELTMEARGRAFLYASRRGLAPVVACLDCGFIFRCPESNTPYTLLRTNKNASEQRWFVSNTSGSRVPAADICERCGSWRLRERGVGIQHVYDEWREKYPSQKIFVLDSETAPTATKAKKIVTEFYNTKSCVLIGTQLALPYLQRGVDVSAIVSLDATRSIPTWRADESLFRLLLRLRECTAKEVLVQARTESDSLIEHASRGAIEKFYDDEIRLRQLLKYPPFSLFILLTWVGSIEMVKKADTLVKEILMNVEAEYYTSPLGSQDKPQRHALIRCNPEKAEQFESINEAVRRLPPFIKVEVNPERII